MVLGFVIKVWFPIYVSFGFISWPFVPFGIDLSEDEVIKVFSLFFFTLLLLKYSGLKKVAWVSSNRSVNR